MSDSTTFVRLFVGFLLSATGVHASCPIEVSPAHVVVKHGDPVSSTCSTSDNDFEGIGWEATEGGTGLESKNHLNWTVNELTNWDVSASCFINPAENSTFEQCNVKLDIVLYTFPENISIASSSDVMREKEQHHFTCDIHNIAPVQNLTVRWYKGDTLYYTDTLNDPSKKPVSPSPVLRFTPSREDNGVTFRCEAHMDLGPEGTQFNLSSQKISIQVLFGPDVRCSDPELREGETLRKHCPVTGNPPPSVTWLKDGQLIDPAVPLTREMAGLYTIKAEGLSLIEKNLQVLVLYGPELSCPSTYTALEYAPHNLTCVVEGYPQPEINWYKDSEEVELPENLTRRDTGQYLIIASNNLSSVNNTIEITVIYPPSQIVELEDSEVDVGSNVSLKCSSTGNPRPKYEWNYYQAANVIEENEDGVSLLVIHNAMAYNMGSYTCHAWNDKGNVSKTVRVTVKGAKQECPIEITPDRMVIQYQGSRPNATCKPTSTSARNLEGEIFWEVLQGHRINSTSLFVNTDEDWDLRPVCAATFKGIGTCRKHLDFTLYKTPDSVSIHSVDNSSLVVEGTEFQLQCYITNVAPVRSLTVQWYRGNETFQPHTEGSLQVPSCLHGAHCLMKQCAPCRRTLESHISEIPSPLSVVSTINVTLNRTDNGAEFKCEAQLDLGVEPRPNMMSSPLKITVHYKPTINTTKLPKTIPVFSGYPEELVCEADGHPAPEIHWKDHLSGDTLIVSEAGFYTCSASNEVDTVSHKVEVILKEDYLPLIAGFVAVTVVIISVIFIFIYSIYYKNTKMRRYSLKNPKLSTHNGNVAHNGWDMQFPMTKLS